MVSFLSMLEQGRPRHSTSRIFIGALPERLEGIEIPSYGRALADLHFLLYVFRRGINIPHSCNRATARTTNASSFFLRHTPIFIMNMCNTQNLNDFLCRPGPGVLRTMRIGRESTCKKANNRKIRAARENRAPHIFLQSDLYPQRRTSASPFRAPCQANARAAEDSTHLTYAVPKV